MQLTLTGVGRERHCVYQIEKYKCTEMIILFSFLRHLRVLCTQNTCLAGKIVSVV